MTKLKSIFMFILTSVLNYVLSFSNQRPFSNFLRKKVSCSNLFGFVQSFASSANLLNLLRDRISLGTNNDNTQQKNMTNNEVSSLSMFASNGINSNGNSNNHNKNSGKISPSSITFSSEELDDINKLNNKLSHYNQSPLQMRSPAHEFELMSSGLDDCSTKRCNVVGYLDYDPKVAASATHKKNSNLLGHKKNPFFR